MEWLPKLVGKARDPGPEMHVGPPLLLGPSSQLWALSMATGTTTLGNRRCPAFVRHLLLIQSSSESMWLVKPNHFLKFCWWEWGGDKYLAFFSLFDAKWSSEFRCSTDSLKKREEKNERKRNLEMFTHLRTSQHFWQNAAWTTFCRKEATVLTWPPSTLSNSVLPLLSKHSLKKTHW